MYGASRLRLLCITLCMGILALGQSIDSWATQAISETALKAVLLYKIPRFIYWPAAVSDLKICVFQEPDFAQALEKLSQQSTGARPIHTLRLTNLADIARCQLIFIPRKMSAQLGGILKKLARSRAVTVSDIEGFARAGGMIEFAPKPSGKGMKILINLPVAKRKKIRFNAQLLRLATILRS